MAEVVPKALYGCALQECAEEVSLFPEDLFYCADCEDLEEGFYCENCLDGAGVPHKDWGMSLAQFFADREIEKQYPLQRTS